MIRLILPLCLLVLVCSCQHGDSPLPQLVLQDHQIREWPLGLTNGRVIAADGCVKAEASQGDPPRTLIFPAGYRVVKHGKGSWRVISAAGKPWAAEGQTRAIGGGEITDGTHYGLLAPDGKGCSVPAWIVFPEPEDMPYPPPSPDPG